MTTTTVSSLSFRSIQGKKPTFKGFFTESYVDSKDLFEDLDDFFGLVKEIPEEKRDSLLENLHKIGSFATEEDETLRIVYIYRPRGETPHELYDGDLNYDTIQKLLKKGEFASKLLGPYTIQEVKFEFTAESKKEAVAEAYDLAEKLELPEHRLKIETGHLDSKPGDKLESILLTSYSNERKVEVEICYLEREVIVTVNEGDSRKMNFEEFSIKKTRKFIEAN